MQAVFLITSAVSTHHHGMQAVAGQAQQEVADLCTVAPALGPPGRHTGCVSEAQGKSLTSELCCKACLKGCIPSPAGRVQEGPLPQVASTQPWSSKKGCSLTLMFGTLQRKHIYSSKAHILVSHVSCHMQ
jgi:hypothetical protein